MNANLKRLLECDRVTLDLIEIEGWRVESNGFTTYFRHESGLTETIPYWIIQIRDAAVRSAIEDAKQQIRDALGIRAGDSEIPIGTNP